MRQMHTLAALFLTIVACVVFAGSGCPIDTGIPILPYANTTDQTNGGATYITAAACNACHSSLAPVLAPHPHTVAMSRVLGSAPTFPGANPTPVPNPPDTYN